MAIRVLATLSAAGLTYLLSTVVFTAACVFWYFSNGEGETAALSFFGVFAVIFIHLVPLYVGWKTWNNFTSWSKRKRWVLAILIIVAALATVIFSYWYLNSRGNYDGPGERWGRHYLDADRMEICDAEHVGDGNPIPAVCRIAWGRAKQYPAIVRPLSGIGLPCL